MRISEFIEGHKKDLKCCRDELKRNPDSISKEIIKEKICLHVRSISELETIISDASTPAVKSFTCEHLKISEGIDRCLLFGYCDPRRCIRHD